MSEIETLGILDEIQALVSDRLQVVSYKWLSRNFSVSSNSAKRLLEEFVEKHGSGVKVVYALSGWLKSNPPSHSFRLVSGPKLTEAQQEFDGNCSVQVYSVQASIPQDPAAIWNAEFVQAEELFNQPSAFDDCLRDSRFCSIINSFVKHNVDGTLVSNAAVQPKIAGIPEHSKVNNAHQNKTVLPPHQNKVQQSSPKVGLLSPNGIKDVKVKSNGTGVHDQATKPSADKEKIHPLPAASKLKGQNDKSSSVSGGSLANLWGRASAKPKPNSALADASADAQICARESIEDGRSDDDAEDVNFRRVSNGESNRKRKVVLDLSDEDEFEDAVNLASPDLPKGQSCVDLKQSKKGLVMNKSNSMLNEVKEDEPKVKEEKTIVKDSNQSKDSSFVSTTVNTKTSLTEKSQISASENNENKKVADSVPNSPKRRKVLKTRIDDRGREVTEVVWEGEETETKKVDSETMKKVDSNTVTNNVNRPAAANKKSPALGSTAPTNAAGSKAGNKKSGNPKDPKQGNILSFFKRV
ncbi:hypothetical protein Q3G72_014871 [Acer saccharum]|nr:hypothetical protein Q3G72_014871 [Acer saccharum]